MITITPVKQDVSFSAELCVHYAKYYAFVFHIAGKKKEGRSLISAWDWDIKDESKKITFMSLPSDVRQDILDAVGEYVTCNFNGF
jgi:hypothetical protein